jgi:hypothetical protein
VAKRDYSAVRDIRRRHVASMTLRGLTQREIVQALPGFGVLNPGTGKPYSLGTVNSDLQHLRGEWRERAARDTADLKAQVLAELREARRAAWTDREINLVLRGLKQEAELLGLEAPAKLDLRVEDLDRAIERELERLAASGEETVTGAPEREERQQ